MNHRRTFLKTAVLAASGTLLAAKAVAAENSLPGGLIYTAANPGKWAGKIDGHTPHVSVEGAKVIVKTGHVMTEKHYIVRHTLVAEDGTVLGENTFYPSDAEAVSRFDLPSGTRGKLYATSFCNNHDLWVTEFSV